MPANYVLLERIELNASAASVTFSNIPQTGYTDLKVVASTRDTNATANNGLFAITLNGSTTFTSAKNLSGNGASAGSGTGDIFVGGGDTAGNTANTFSNVEVYFPNYTSTSQKSISADAVNEQNGTTAYMALTAQLFNLTTAITSISIAGRSGFDTNSTFSLYGLAALGTTPAIAPKASGGSIYTDGTYWYHAFRANGTFTPQTGLSCEALVIAGGGAGGYNGGGGGGAGGLRSLSSQSFASGVSYTCTIGAGGSPNNSNGTVGGSGITSTITGSGFSTISASGGGGGGAQSVNGVTGGSGGAGGKNGAAGAAGNSGSYSPVEGYAGGNSNGGVGAGGGGGAGAAGSLGTSNGGAGGTGNTSLSTWLTTTVAGVSGSIAGGGGGGSDNTGGSATGGGGAGGSTNANGTAATINTGGGGGGGGTGGSAGSGAAGGSGLVIIRYLAA